MARAVLRPATAMERTHLHSLREGVHQGLTEHTLMGGLKETTRPKMLQQGIPAFGGRRLVELQVAAPKTRRGHICAGLVDIFQNQVLMTTAAACILGQGLKPFAAVAEGKPLNWRLVYKSGGMPSSHTSTVTALATAVGLERGLNDDLFAVCVVLAAIVMYDAQGVRYAVGKQAEVLNSIVIPEITNAPENLLNLAELREAPQAEEMIATRTAGQAGPSSRLQENTWHSSIGHPQSATDRLSAPEMRGGEAPDYNPETQSAVATLEKVRSENGRVRQAGFPKAWKHVPLKEAIGHSKVEVAVGGLAGIVLAFLFHSTVFGSH